MQQTPQEVLKRYFGYDSFRPLQENIINTILSGQDCLSIIPTGGGKSLCFQIPGLILLGTTIVISPLISLMEDQVQQLQKRGIEAVQLSSSLSKENRVEVEAEIKLGTVKFIYLSPEQLQTKKWQQLSKDLTIPLIVVDEAHCISQWGHDFRPPYREIASWVFSLPKRPTLAAFTATATEHTAKDIISSLKLSNTKVYKEDSLPEHLWWNVVDCSDKFHRWLRLFQLVKKHQGQSGFIYTLTRSATEEITSILRDFFPSLKIAFYHGGMSSKDRQIIQQQFVDNQLDVIVATNAFGMGVDKPNIRFVIHFHTPNSIEAYVQEVGRAGRDRNEAHCYLLFQPNDQKINIQLIGEDTRKQQKYILLLQLLKHRRCLKHNTAIYFSIKYRGQCNKCSKCVKNNKLQLMKVNRERCLSLKQLALLKVVSPISLELLKKIPGLGQGWFEKSLPLLQDDKIYKSLIKKTES